MNEKSKISNKWWFRFLKVVFILLFLAVTAFSVVIVFEDTKPETDFYSSTYNLLCDSGDVRGEITYDMLENTGYYPIALENLEFIDENTARTARFACEYGGFLDGLTEKESENWIDLAYKNKVDDIPTFTN